MSYYEYKDEARRLKVMMDFVQREQYLHTPGTIGWQKVELELLDIRIKYYDVMYDLYDARGLTKNAINARSMMEQCIRQQDRLKESLAILSR